MWNRWWEIARTSMIEKIQIYKSQKKFQLRETVEESCTEVAIVLPSQQPRVRILTLPKFSNDLMSVSLWGVAWTVNKALETKKKPHLGARSFNPTLSFLSKWIRTWIAQLWAFCQRLWAPSLHRPLMFIKMLFCLLRCILLMNQSPLLRFLLQQNVDHSLDNCEKTMIDSESEVERFLCRIVKLKKIK